MTNLMMMIFPEDVRAWIGVKKIAKTEKRMELPLSRHVTLFDVDFGDVQGVCAMYFPILSIALSVAFCFQQKIDELPIFRSHGPFFHWESSHQALVQGGPLIVVLVFMILVFLDGSF